MRVLTQTAEAERAAFESEWSGRGCTCFISPPCAFCTHPGNPLNQDEDDSAWEEVDAVCVNNTGLEDRFDLGVEYVVEETELSNMVYAYDKNGIGVVLFKDRFKW